MGIITNPVEGGVGLFGINVERQAHVRRWPAKDLRGHAIRIYAEEGHLIKDENSVNEDFRRRAGKKLLEDEKRVIKDVKQLTEEIKESVRDISAIGQFVLEHLVQLIREDQKLEHNPKIKAVMEQAMRERQELHNVFSQAANLFSTEG